MASSPTTKHSGWSVTSDGGSEGKKSVTRRGAVGLAIGKIDGPAGWTEITLITGADQTAMATEVIAAAIDCYEGGLEKPQEKSVIGGQLGGLQSALRYIIRNGGAAPRKPQAFCGLWRLASTTTNVGLLKADWCPSHAKRPEWMCELPSSTEAARILNDKADKAAGRAFVKHKVEASEEKIKEDVKCGQRALQTVVKLYNEYADHIGIVTKNRTAM